MIDTPAFGSARQARLLKPLSHTNRNCHPRTKMYEAGDTITVRWLHTWKMSDGMRGLGAGVEGTDFEFA